MAKKKKIALHFQILIGLILGTGWALLSAYMGWSSFTADWIAPWGDMFINALKLVAVPLVLFSIMQGITSLSDTNSLGRLGLKTIAIYIGTTMTAITIGLVVVNVLKPGESVSEEQRIINRISYELWVESTPGVEKLDQLDYSHNPKYSQYVSDAMRQTQEMESEGAIGKKAVDKRAQMDHGPLQMVVDMVPNNIFSSLTNNSMLQIIFFAIFFGIVIVGLPYERVETVIKLIHGANDIFIKMVDVIMWVAPYFVFALMAGKVSELAGDDPDAVIEIFKGLASYSGTVILGLGLLIFALYPLVVKLVTGQIGYSDFFKAMSPAQLLAFSTSSSAATLPVTMECVSDNLGVKEEVSSFVLPIGATVNMDGTSLYQGVAVVFLAQFHMIDLTLAQQLTIILTATLASIGSAAIPSAGLIMMVVVLQSVGLNPAWIAIIFPVDRFLDMCRTVVNVTGDASVASIIAKTEGKLDPK
ncbi:dicarboxylate/amino acid:cation symporter [bacterium SCSIO 12643]|nr:dicarboxylate/amino acid:cation symporter [bacterium SCSIO 12643]